MFQSFEFLKETYAYTKRGQLKNQRAMCPLTVVRFSDGLYCSLSPELLRSNVVMLLFFFLASPSPPPSFSPCLPPSCVQANPRAGTDAAAARKEGCSEACRAKLLTCY